jgi:hypothetical protein
VFKIQEKPSGNVETVDRIPKNVKIELSDDPTLSLLGIFSETENKISKTHKYCHLLSRIIYNSQDMETTYRSITCSELSQGE